MDAEGMIFNLYKLVHKYLKHVFPPRILETLNLLNDAERLISLYN